MIDKLKSKPFLSQKCLEILIYSVIWIVIAIIPLFWNYNYDEEDDEYYCSMDIDEDEWYRIHTHYKGQCPFFRQADDYYTARRQ